MISETLLGSLFWPKWGQCLNGSKPMLTICQLVEQMIQVEEPEIYYAFVVVGFPLSQLIIRWLSQSFWNILNWQEIMQLICLGCTMGPDYIVYFVTSLFRHLKPMIQSHGCRLNLVEFGLQCSLYGFATVEYLDFMHTLRSKYQSVILHHLVF